jgi:group I intron endonuclease
MGYIYKITNTKNNKCYIGVTIKENPNERWCAHKSNIRNDRGCPLLMKAFNKHGEESFKFEVLIICFDDDVYYYEEEYIKKYNSASPNGYNVAEGGKSGRNFLGKTHSDETKKKIGLKSKEYNSKPEVRERSRQIMIELNRSGKIKRNTENWKKAVTEGRIGGSNFSEETRKKISEKLKGHFKSEETKRKHSETMTKINGRKVGQYTLDGYLIAKFNTIKEASALTSIPRSTIQATASGRCKTGKGFIWKYADIEEKELKDPAIE